MNREKAPSKRKQRACLLWERFGLPCLALPPSPATGTHLAPAMAMSFRTPKRKMPPKCRQVLSFGRLFPQLEPITVLIERGVKNMSQALWLALTELRKRWIGFSAGIVFAVFLGLMTGALLNGYLNDPEKANLNDLLVDYLLVGVLPALGIVGFSREYLSWSSLREDPFLKRLGFLRMWPIPLSVIVWSRLIHSLINYVAGTFAMFAAMTTVGWTGYVSQWGLPLYGFFLLFWFGYGLALSGLFTCLESGIRFKTYTVISFALVFVLFGGLFFWHVTAWNQGRAVFEGVLHLIQAHEVLPVLAVCLVAVVFVGLWKKVMTRRIARVDLP